MPRTSLAFVLSAALFTIGCEPTPPAPTATPVAEAHGHDHDGHDHDGHDHDGHDHDVINAAQAGLDADSLPPSGNPNPPETLSQGSQQLTEMVTKINAGLADDDVDSVHDELHDIGNLLEQVEDLVAASELTDQAKTQAAAAINSLFDAYGEIDKQLHGDEGKSFADVRSDIEAAIESFGDAVK